MAIQAAALFPEGRAGDPALLLAGQPGQGPSGHALRLLWYSGQSEPAESAAAGVAIQVATLFQREGEQGGRLALLLHQAG
jgi:hypothetical protein